MKRILALILAGALYAPASFAYNAAPSPAPAYSDGSGNQINGAVSQCWNGTALVVCSSGGGSSASSPTFTQSVPYKSATVITPGTAFTAGRAVAVTLSVGGTVTLTLSGGGTLAMTLPISTETVIIPVSATNAALSGGATGTLTNLN